MHFDQWSLENVDTAVKHIIQKMETTIGNGGHVEIRGFGSFSLHYRKARMDHNPKNGDAVAIPEKFVPH